MRMHQVVHNERFAAGLLPCGLGRQQPQNGLVLACDNKIGNCSQQENPVGKGAV